MFTSLLVPPLLFFALGFVAHLLRSDLHLPKNAITMLSVYLMIGIGLQGGAELMHLDLSSSLIAVLAGIAFGLIQPLIAYAVLHGYGSVDKINAAAIAAHYGSVSVGTFLSATAFLGTMGVEYEPYPLIMLAVMEVPAIIVGLFLINRAGVAKKAKQKALAWGAVLHKAATNGSVVLLLGGMLIGGICSDASLQAMSPFYSGIFSGMLTLFLLGMGIEAASHLRDFKEAGWFYAAFGTLLPLLFGCFGVFVGAQLLGFSAGGSMLVGVLAASASYIAVPSAMRLAVPEANPSLYLTLSLGITFPFNVVIGIPVYWRVAQLLLG
ncbi:MAG: sodium-dependent bicarbonate transport family permease [Candidatus Dependentiae bacterium]|jgi:hypothetical protein